MNFGSHKGESISEFYDYDSQYIRWCFNNIPNFYNRLDDEDKLFVYKLTYPISYLTKKYGRLHDIGESRFINILKEEGLLYYCNTGQESNGNGEFYTVEGVYGCHYGGISPMSDHCVMFIMKEYLMNYIINGSNNTFQKYIKEIK